MNKKTRLGSSTLEVPAICFGTSSLGDMPNTYGYGVDEERAQFSKAGITLLCCKNSGGNASSAKIVAARDLGLPVWFLARRSDEAAGGNQNSLEKFQIHDSVDAIALAAFDLATSHTKR